MGEGYTLQDGRIQLSSPEPQGSSWKRLGGKSRRPSEVAEEKEDSINVRAREGLG